MNVTAKYKHARLSAQKARLVVDQVRGVSVGKAFDILGFSTKKAATFVKKTLESAISNAENNFGLDIDELTVRHIFVDEGATYKRWRARAKGRSNRLFKRTCHITIVLSGD